MKGCCHFIHDVFIAFDDFLEILEPVIVYLFIQLVQARTSVLSSDKQVQISSQSHQQQRQGEYWTMNLSLYSVQAFVVLDSEGNRVLAKYYRSKSHPQGESKELLTLKEQKVFEKGLWQKTKKPGGVCVLFVS